MTPKDVLGRDLYIGARVGVAFSYSQASVGHIRVGVLEQMNDLNDFRIRWIDGKLSPSIKYGSETRWVIL